MSSEALGAVPRLASFLTSTCEPRTQSAEEGQHGSLHVRETVLARELVQGCHIKSVSLFNCLEALDGDETLRMSGVWGFSVFSLIIFYCNLF